MKKLLSIILSTFLLASTVFGYTTLTRIRNFVNDKNNGVPITSSYMDAELNQLVTALNLTGVVQGSAPTSPTNGTIWFDSTNKVLKIFRNNEFVVYGAYIGQTAYPATPQTGDLYSNWSAAIPNLQQYTGTNWSSIVPVNASNINWTSVNSSQINSSGINWNNINGIGPINSGGVNWINIPGDASGNFLQSNGNNTVNWTASNHGIQLFTSSGSFTAPSGVTKVYLDGCGSGASGGNGAQGLTGGGGGAACVTNYPYTVIPGNVYTVTINNAGVGTSSSTADGQDGGNVIFDSLTLQGGKGGKGSASTGNGGAGGALGSTSTNSFDGSASVSTAGTAGEAPGGGFRGGNGAFRGNASHGGGTLFGQGATGTTGGPNSAITGFGGGGSGGGSALPGANYPGGSGLKGFIAVKW